MIEAHELQTAKRIQRDTGPTFHLATRFLPKRVRHPTYVLYAFFRKADQVVDTTDPLRPPQQAAVLNEYEAAVLGRRETEDPVLGAMAELVEAYDLDPVDIEEFMAAMKSDIDTDSYPTQSALDGYLRGSAVAVGYMMLRIMAPESGHARPNAKALGEAFQLTNFLRDVREDALDFDRVYLPEETLHRHGVDVETVRSLEPSRGMRAAIRSELDRTEAKYREGVAGIQHLPSDCQFPVLLAAVLYAEYHRLIAAQGYDVLSSQPAIPKWRYLTLLLETGWHWYRHADPERVFYRVSPIQPEPSRETHRGSWSRGRAAKSMARVRRSFNSMLSDSRLGR